MGRLYFLVEFPMSLPVTWDVLATDHEVVMGKEVEFGRLHLPTYQGNRPHQNSPLGPPDLDDAEAARFVEEWETIARHRDDLPHFWGWLYSQRVPEGETEPTDSKSLLEHAVFSINPGTVTKDDLGARATELAQALREWLRSTCLWLEMLAELEPEVPFRDEIADHRLVGPHVGYVDHFGESPPAFFSTRQKLWTQLRTVAATRYHLEWAAHLTNFGCTPADERVLLRDAQAARARDDRRRAVFDAATATEIVVQTFLDKQGPSIDPRVPIGKRIEEARDRGMALDADLLAKVFHPRNAAIHKGTQLTQEQVRTSLDAARVVIGDHSPIPKIPDPS